VDPAVSSPSLFSLSLIIEGEEEDVDNVGRDMR
jgi:hypothetical protein